MSHTANIKGFGDDKRSYVRCSSLGNYRYWRNRAYKHALEQCRKHHVVWSWSDFQLYVQGYQHMHQVDISTPELLVHLYNGEPHLEGGWNCSMYQRINRHLNTLATNGTIHYTMVKGRRYYEYAGV